MGGVCSGDTKQQKKYLDIKRKMKKQAKLQQALLEANRQKEAEMQIVARDYRNLAEEVDALRAENSALRTELKNASAEI